MVVFVGVVVLIAGFFVAPPQGFVMIAVGLGLGSLAGLELSVREHFAGYRSHTLLLSAAIGVPIFGVLFVATRISTPICVAAGARGVRGLRLALHSGLPPALRRSPLPPQRLIGPPLAGPRHR